jgi:hypothetical protein
VPPNEFELKYTLCERHDGLSSLGALHDKLSKELSRDLSRKGKYLFKQGEETMQRYYLAGSEQESPFRTLHIYHDGENYHAALKTNTDTSNTSAQKGYRQRLSCAWLTADVTATPANSDEQ